MLLIKCTPKCRFLLKLRLRKSCSVTWYVHLQVLFVGRAQCGPITVAEKVSHFLAWTKCVLLSLCLSGDPDRGRIETAGLNPTTVWVPAARQDPLIGSDGDKACKQLLPGAFIVSSRSTGQVSFAGSCFLYVCEKDFSRHRLLDECRARYVSSASR